MQKTVTEAGLTKLNKAELTAIADIFELEVGDVTNKELVVVLQPLVRESGSVVIEVETPPESAGGIGGNGGMGPGFVNPARLPDADRVCISLDSKETSSEFSMVSVNGRSFAIPHGVPCMVPPYIVSVIRNAKEVRETHNPQTKKTTTTEKPRFSLSTHAEGSPEFEEAQVLHASKSTQPQDVAIQR